MAISADWHRHLGWWFRWLTRLAGAIVLAIAIWSFFKFAPKCGHANQAICPSYALQSRLIFQGERSAVVLLGLTILMVLLFRLVFQGRLPDRISRDGVEWGPEAIEQFKEDVETVKTTADSLQKQIDALKKVVTELV